MLGFGGAKNKLIEEFGVDLATDLARRFPVDLESSTGRKMPDKLQRALTQVAMRALAFRDEQRIGVYGKARLLRGFGAELARLGYSDEFVESATTALVKSLAVQSPEG